MHLAMQSSCWCKEAVQYLIMSSLSGRQEFMLLAGHGSIVRLLCSRWQQLCCGSLHFWQLQAGQLLW